MAEFVQAEILGTKFETTTRYANVQPIGLGAFGIVCSAFDRIAQQHVAVKKMINPFATSAVAKRTYREVKLLKHLRHENLISLCDIFISPSEDIYLTTELLGSDLHRLMGTSPLDGKFAQYFMYQLMRGLKYIHSAGVIHRDLKPSNLLVNENCDLKICDFGLARIQEPQMTGYVSTRYYRAPEIMLTWQRYGNEVDIWSAGCILAEMLQGKPLFPGSDHIQQFYMITDIIGNPPIEVVDRITSGNTRRLVESLQDKPPRLLKNVLAGSDPAAVDLLDNMLLFDSAKRLSAEDCLKHPYMAAYHDPTDEPVAEQKFDWSFNDISYPKDTWKIMIYSEVLDYHSTTSGVEPDPDFTNLDFYLQDM